MGIRPHAVFENPTPRLLLYRNSRPVEDNQYWHNEVNALSICNTIDNSPNISRKINRKGERDCILIVGPTGFLGKQILNQVVKDKHWHKIICLLRPPLDRIALDDPRLLLINA